MGALGRLLSPGGQGESSTKTLVDSKQLEGARPITPEDNTQSAEYLLLQCSVGANVYDVYQVYTGNGSSE